MKIPTSETETMAACGTF